MTKKKKNKIELNQKLSGISVNGVSQFDPSLVLAKGNKTVLTGSEVSLIPEDKNISVSLNQFGDKITPENSMIFQNDIDRAPYAGQSLVDSPMTIGGFPNYKVKKEFSEEEIEDIENKLEEKKKLSKDNKDPITVKDITEEVLKKLKIQEANEEKETKNAVVSGIKIIEEKIKSGGKTKWRCAICGNFIEELNESKNIKKYLSEFSAGKFKKCKKNHLNWFVVNENEIVFSAKNNLDREFNI